MTVSLHFTAMGALLVHQNGKLVDANAAARSLFKLKDSLADISIFDWFDSDLVSTVLADSEGASIGVAEVELRGADGQAFPAEICRRQITLAGGGDEFAILAPSIVEPSEAMSLAERLLDILKESVRLNNVEVMINASIGIALFPADGDTI
ncbi:MAG: PAS domain-containing protein, partial [Burkholderiaceae bacterium]